MTVQEIKELKQRVLNGGSITLEEAVALISTPNKEALYDSAEEITRAFCPRVFDSCSIVNARSGKCSENCKWCAQSAHFSTGCDTYDLIDEKECMEAARYNHDRGVRRFSLVASGRAVRGEALTKVCSLLRRIKDEVGIFTCASLGLLSPDELDRLWEAGVRRYHCNLEAAPSYFGKLCTTHTIADKLATIRAARTRGFEVCSGGIIGMGETPAQRAELAVTLREVNPASIPINVLCPIPGTPLADSAPLTDDEVLSTIAVFRFVHPAVQLRFAGGRARLSTDTQLRALRIGMNGGVVGDLLTTVGSRIAEDQNLVSEAGYEF
ncbi:MAG: biotin synthase BioB [Muribaculaceae bacterium]|nr:biotin synthase BioB [Muribaculaceae bacterium]